MSFTFLGFKINVSFLLRSISSLVFASIGVATAALDEISFFHYSAIKHALLKEIIHRCQQLSYAAKLSAAFLNITYFGCIRLNGLHIIGI